MSDVFRSVTLLMAHTLFGLIGYGYVAIVWRGIGMCAGHFPTWRGLTWDRFTVLSITHQYWLVIPMIRTFVRGSELLFIFRRLVVLIFSAKDIKHMF